MRIQDIKTLPSIESVSNDFNLAKELLSNLDKQGDSFKRILKDNPTLKEHLFQDDNKVASRIEKISKFAKLLSKLEITQLEMEVNEIPDAMESFKEIVAGVSQTLLSCLS